ncbi:MAG TPA: hypothetical protein EYP24_05910 [bacterium (Candidatus Stahlbacteria)]|nr:hypothetical protein [Candidatus Stahlbacteria bacterium]
MARYIDNHNIAAWRDSSPTFEEVIGELNQGYPHSMCVGLTAAGHLVLAVGQVLNWHTLIFNDPYGNKNTPGYPSYDGKYARYDWPGYNNGYENLNYVYWSVYSHGDWEPATDTIVDDLQFNDGFYLHTNSPSSMAYWWDNLIGYRNHMWWTYTTHAQGIDTCYATWDPVLPKGGLYEVFVYIPQVSNPAQSARYQVYYTGGVDTIIVDQSQHPNQWLSLGIYPFTDSTGYLYLGDATGTQGRHIVFDAVCWDYRGPEIEEDISANASKPLLRTNVITDLITLNFDLTEANKITLSVLTVDGRVVKKIKRLIPAGPTSINLSIAHLPPAVYYLLITTPAHSTHLKLIKI